MAVWIQLVLGYNLYFDVCHEQQKEVILSLKSNGRRYAIEYGFASILRDFVGDAIIDECIRVTK